MSDLLRAYTAFTGDVGTVALAADSCSSEAAQNLPENLVLLLETGPAGVNT